jgi:hypothetical protein
MNTLRHALAVGAALLVAGTAADAQVRRTTGTVYQDPQTLPSGTCRVWLDGLPASRQPAPTDCASARRNQPRNSRIIYGTGSTGVYGNRDPRSIPGSPQYDPRYDPRSSQYDPRLDSRNRGNNGRYDKYDRKAEKEREKAARKRNKEWQKSQRDNGKHDDHDDNRYGNRDRSGQVNPRGLPQPVQQGTTRRVCVDANRDGRCDDGGPLIRTP